MLSFIHPLLLWGLPVIAAPVLIHLINMLRHRRVEWAAMEFLLLSQKKHRTWIILKQLLLLLMRMLAVAAVVLIVAQPRVRDRLGSLLGTEQTHHIVLLDDSFSMADHWGDTNAFAQAKSVIERVRGAAARQQQPQSFTLLRLSRAGQYGGGLQADFTKEPVDSQFPDRLADKLKSVGASQTAADAVPALEAVAQWLGEGEGERRIIYLVSDFRARQWDEPSELRKRLLEFNQAGAELRLVNCVDALRPNLAIASLAPEEGIRSAGIEWVMEVAVRNFGSTQVENVPVVVTTDGKARPSVSIAKIPARGVVKERFTVSFPAPGEHLIQAQLDPDAVSDDNVRFCVVDLSADMPVLLIDSDPGARDAKGLAWALAPGGTVRTGIQPRIEQPSFLTKRPPDETLADLQRFRAITLANVERLDNSAVEILEKYVAAGGGIAIFAGDRTGIRFLNEGLYREGKGMFPLPAAGPSELLVDRLDKAPDISAEEHFLFRSFQDRRNDLLGTVLIERYMAAPKGWKPPADSTTRVIARLRNGAPLIVEKGHGKGRVVVLLTTAAPIWNNWARSGTFPAVLRDLHAYLAQRPVNGASHLVGTPLELKLAPAEYQAQVQFSRNGEPTGIMVDAVPGGEGQLAATLPQIEQSGFYEAQLTTTKGEGETRVYAVNVDPLEGDLQALGKADLASRLTDVKYEFEQAAAFQSDNGDMAGYNLSQAILLALVALLIAEQILAWSCGYHPVARAGAGAPAPAWNGRGRGGEDPALQEVRAAVAAEGGVR